MSNEEIKNVSQIKKKLGITDIDKITEEQVSAFVDMIPYIDPEVAIEFIKCLPSTIQATSQITAQLKDLSNKGMEASTESNNAAMKGYQTVLDSMADALKDGNVSPEEREKIFDEMKDVAADMDHKDTEQKEHILTILKIGGETILKGALIIGACVLGARYLGGGKDK